MLVERECRLLFGRLQAHSAIRVPRIIQRGFSSAQHNAVLDETAVTLCTGHYSSGQVLVPNKVLTKCCAL